MTESILNMLQECTGIVLQIAALIVLLLLRSLRDHVQKYYSSTTTHSERQVLTQLGREAFAYAETVFRAHDGPAKLNEAVKYMLDKSKANGLGEVHMQDMRAMIEAAWIEDRRSRGEKIDPSGAVSEEVR